MGWPKSVVFWLSLSKVTVRKWATLEEILYHDCSHNSLLSMDKKEEKTLCFSSATGVSKRFLTRQSVYFHILYSCTANESSIITSIRGICQQRIIDGGNHLDVFNGILERLEMSGETNPQTRALLFWIVLISRWMLYLLMTLHYQNKSISLTSFSIPKIPPRPSYSVCFDVI